MQQFEYDAELTGAGESCTKCGFAGTMPANSIYHVRDWCKGMMVIPGVYRLKIRNMKGGEWKEFGPIDTRPVAETILPKKRRGESG